MRRDQAEVDRVIKDWTNHTLLGEPREVGLRREDYAKYHGDRCLQALDLIPNPGERGTLLELGSGLYLMTFLLERFVNYDLELVQYWDKPDGDYESILLDTSNGGKRKTYPFKHFDAETSVFPYPDGSFDVIVSCEILEHFLCDPVHVLAECHRVLKPGGVIVLTTPNAMRWNNISKLIRGKNIFDKYVRESASARHPREYIPAEVVALFEAVGFDVTHMDTKDLTREDEGPFVKVVTRCSVGLFDAADRLRGRGGSPTAKWRGQHIFLVAKRKGTATKVYPEFLFEKAHLSGPVIDAICRPTNSSSE
jgi:SAM-dependent methyltransferase